MTVTFVCLKSVLCLEERACLSSALLPFERVLRLQVCRQVRVRDFVDGSKSPDCRHVGMVLRGHQLDLLYFQPNQPAC